MTQILQWNKNSTPNDSPYESQIFNQDHNKYQMLPPINRIKTQGAKGKSKKRKEGGGNHSFEVGNFSHKALNLLESGKSRVKAVHRPIWKPSGAIIPKDGYTTKPKVYY